MFAVSVASFNPRDPPFKVRELADEFLPYGTLISVQVWQPGFAVVEFEELKSALEAALQHDGRHGWRVNPFPLPHTRADHFERFKSLVQRERERERGRGPGTGPGNRDGRGPELGQNGCNLCGKPGHSSSDCRLLRRPGGTRTNPSPPNRMHPTPPSRRRRSRSPNPPSSSMNPNPQNRMSSSNPPNNNSSRSPTPPTLNIPPTPGNFLFADSGEESPRSSSSNPPNRSMSPNPPNLSRWPTPPTPGNFLFAEQGDASPRSSSSNPPNRSMSPTPPTRKRRRSPIIGFDHATRPRSRRRRRSRIPSPPGYGHRS